MSQWKEFYDLARDFCNKNRDSNVDTIDTILEQIEKKSSFNFPASDDTKAACKNLSEALQNAVKAELREDTDEVKPISETCTTKQQHPILSMCLAFMPSLLHLLFPL